MKIVAMIARYLLGAAFLVFGLNKFFNFIPSGPPPAGVAGQFMAAMISTKYIMLVGLFEAVGGILLLFNRYVPLALALLAPVIVNILAVNILMVLLLSLQCRRCHPLDPGLHPRSLRVPALYQARVES